LLERLVGQPPVSRDFHVLQHTFLAQIGHREDFRQRLASLYEEWRGNLARGLEVDLAGRPGARAVSPRAMASFVQALLHGLAVQAAADPDAFRREEMRDLCLEVLGTYLGIEPAPGRNGRKSPGERQVSSGPAAGTGARPGPLQRGEP
jgi:hypothetical protein